MTFQQLQYLLEVNKTASFSLAAKNLFVTQSSVSNAIIALEQELGYPIFLRSRNGLIPTPEGMDVISHAESICESHRLMTNRSQPQKRSVRVSTVRYQPIYDAFFRLIQEVQHREDVALSIEDINGSSAPALDRLPVYELEMVVQYAFSSLSNAVISDIQKHQLHCEILDSIPCGICIGTGHRLYSQPEINLREFENETLLDNPERTVSTAKPLTAFLHIHPNRVMCVTDTAFREQLIREGNAYEIGPIPPVSNPQISDFRYIPLSGLSYNILAITNKLNSSTPEFQRYLELLREECAAYRNRELDLMPL